MALAQQLFFATFRLDLANEQLWEGEALVALRPKLFAVLRQLVENAGRLITREELHRSAWQGTTVSESVLRGTIRELREVLHDDATAPRFIETVPHRGYRFLAPVTAAPDPARDAPTSSGTARDRAVALPLREQRTDAGSLPVGREAELAALGRCLERALRGERQVVFVTGEPGIGKTTLVDTFLARVERDGATPRRETEPAGRPTAVLVGSGQCVEHYGAAEAYLPVLDALGRLCRRSGGASVLAQLRRWAPTWLVQMPGLLDDDELESLQRRVQGATRERMLREMAEALEVLTQETPVVLVLEDLHWSDPSTLDLISLLAQRREPARAMVVGTYRPADVAVSQHPLLSLRRELELHRRCEEIPLELLSASEIGQYLTNRFPRRHVPPELARVVHRRTEGNPLFMVHLVDDWVRQGALVEEDDAWKAADGDVENLAASVPESLRQLIEKQLERLEPEQLRVLEAASVAGGTSTTATLSACLDEPLEQIEERCERLARRGQLLRAQGVERASDGTLASRYAFPHALFQQMLYERTSVVQRARLHLRIGEWEAAQHGPRASESASELAMHFERGQDYERAVVHLAQAGRNALRRSAHLEATTLLRRGLELLQALPETRARLEHELVLQDALGAALVVTRGYGSPEVQQAYERAFHLCRELGESPSIFPVLGGLWTYRFLRAELREAADLAGKLSRVAAAEEDPALTVWANAVGGMTAATLGELSTALGRLEAGSLLYDERSHGPERLRAGAQDPKLTCLAYAAWTLWRLGHPDQARRKVDEVLTAARELAHPFSLAFALDFAGNGVGMFLRDVRLVRACADELAALSEEQTFPYWLAWGTVRQGWVLVQQGRVEEGMEKMRRGMDSIRRTGAELSISYVLAQLSEAHAKLGQPDAGLSLLREALAHVQQTGERWYEAELHRLEGELTLQRSELRSPAVLPRGGRFVTGGRRRGSPRASARFRASESSEGASASAHQGGAREEAEASFVRAMEVARSQQARSFELRAATSLARSWTTRGRREEARAALAAVYDAFTEGFDTPDLQDARSLLAELATTRA